MFLTSALQEVNMNEDIVTLLRDAVVAAGSEVKASLATEYERKGYAQRVDVWPAASAYRQEANDFYVLTIEVKVPMKFAPGELYQSVVDSVEALKSLQENALQTRRDALEAELKKVTTQMENL